MKEVVKKKLNIRPYLEKLGFDTSKNLTECKFHNSKNKQDFSWNEEMYHCFGCGAKGDVLDLIARLNGLDIKRDFIKVLKIAANDAGVKLDITEKYADKLNKEKEREEKLKKSHNLFLNWCISQMDDIQTNYIINKRKISKETINRFKIGYFPQNKIYELKKYLLENNVS